MSYRLRIHQRLDGEFRQVAQEQIAAAIDELAGDAADRVHQARKRFKKVRGLLRLFRGAFGSFRRESAWYRDLGRKLSSVRDAEAVVEACSSLKQSPAATEHLRGQLALLVESVRSPGQVAAEYRIDEVLAELNEGFDRADAWRLDSDGFGAMRRGVERCYRSGRRRMVDFAKRPSPERLHAWRKRVKDHWYHTRLLHGTWPDVMRARRRSLGMLSELLGDANDLVLVGTSIESHAAELDDANGLRLLVESRRTELTAAAIRLGRLAFCERPAALAGRWQAYWKAARRQSQPSRDGIQHCRPVNHVG